MLQSVTVNYFTPSTIGNLNSHWGLHWYYSPSNFLFWLQLAYSGNRQPYLIIHSKRRYLGACHSRTFGCQLPSLDYSTKSCSSASLPRRWCWYELGSNWVMNQIVKHEVPCQTSTCVGIHPWRSGLHSCKHTAQEVNVVPNQTPCHCKCVEAATKNGWNALQDHPLVGGRLWYVIFVSQMYQGSAYVGQKGESSCWTGCTSILKPKWACSSKCEMLCHIHLSRKIGHASESGCEEAWQCLRIPVYSDNSRRRVLWIYGRLQHS